MNGQFTEAPAEIHQIVGRDLLIGEDDQFVLDQCVLDYMEYLVLKRLTKIDAADLGAQIDPTRFTVTPPRTEVIGLPCRASTGLFI
jgi:hypothetical protein